MMTSPQFLPQTRLVTTLGASGIGECAELVMPKDGEVVISVACREGVKRRKEMVWAGNTLSITDAEYGKVYSWNVRYIEGGDNDHR